MHLPDGLTNGGNIQGYKKYVTVFLKWKHRYFAASFLTSVVKKKW